jgi:hypothetical protein
MSTKTTFKRIALVAVAALTLGSFSAVSATAVPVTVATTAPCYVSTAPYMTPNAAGTDTATATLTATQVAGPANYVEVTCEKDLGSGTTAVVTTSAGSTLASFSDSSTSGQWTVATGALSATSANNAITDTIFRVMTPTAGTVTTTIASRAFVNGGATDTTRQTLTITVTEAAVAGVATAANSTSIISKGTDFTGAEADEAVVGDNTPATPVQVASILVTAKDANKTTILTAPISATISGPGLLGISDTQANVLIANTPATLRAVAVTTTDGIAVITVAGDGTGVGGVATITISSGTTVLATETVTFAGKAASLAAALTSGQKTWISATAGSNTTTLDVTAKDAAGSAATLPTLKVTPADATIATATVASGLVTITGVKAGTTVITIADSATGTTVTPTTYTINVKATTTTAAPVVTFDKSDYTPGELMTITIAVDVADTNYQAFSAIPVASASLNTLKSPFVDSSGTASTTAGYVKLVGGKGIWTAYAPLASGPLTVSATTVAGVGPTLATAVSATAGVTNEALDAASEAIDAANAATDAANAAAEAADAATAAAQDAADAVAALSTQVATYISNLRKQITSLTNLVIKIQKKVKA